MEDVPPKPDGRIVRLILEHRSQLFAYIYARVPNRADAEDLVQETFLTAFEKFNEFEPGTSFIAWVRQIAYYKIKNFQRTFARSRVIFDERLLEHLEISNHKLQPELDRYHEALESCLAKLKPRDRTAIETRYAENGSVAAAAKSSGRSIVATYKALHRMRETLLTCVRRQLPSH